MDHFMVYGYELDYLKYQVHNYGPKFIIHVYVLGWKKHKLIRMDHNVWSMVMNLTL